MALEAIDGGGYRSKSLETQVDSLPREKKSRLSEPPTTWEPPKRVADGKSQGDAQSAKSSSPGLLTEAWRLFRWVAWDPHPEPHEPPLNAADENYAENLYKTLKPDLHGSAYVTAEVFSYTNNNGHSFDVDVPGRKAVPIGRLEEWGDRLNIAAAYVGHGFDKVDEALLSVWDLTNIIPWSAQKLQNGEKETRLQYAARLSQNAGRWLLGGLRLVAIGAVGLPFWIARVSLILSAMAVALGSYIVGGAAYLVLRGGGQTIKAGVEHEATSAWLDRSVRHFLREPSQSFFEFRTFLWKNTVNSYIGTHLRSLFLSSGRGTHAHLRRTFLEEVHESISLLKSSAKRLADIKSIKGKDSNIDGQIDNILNDSASTIDAILFLAERDVDRKDLYYADQIPSEYKDSFENFIDKYISLYDRLFPQNGNEDKFREKLVALKASGVMISTRIPAGFLDSFSLQALVWAKAGPIELSTMGKPNPIDAYCAQLLNDMRVLLEVEDHLSGRDASKPAEKIPELLNDRENSPIQLSRKSYCPEMKGCIGYIIAFDRIQAALANPASTIRWVMSKAGVTPDKPETLENAFRTLPVGDKAILRFGSGKGPGSLLWGFIPIPDSITYLGGGLLAGFIHSYSYEMEIKKTGDHQFSLSLSREYLLKAKFGLEAWIAVKTPFLDEKRYPNAPFHAGVDIATSGVWDWQGGSRQKISAAFFDDQLFGGDGILRKMASGRLDLREFMDDARITNVILEHIKRSNLAGSVGFGFVSLGQVGGNTRTQPYFYWWSEGTLHRIRLTESVLSKHISRNANGDFFLSVQDKTAKLKKVTLTAYSQAVFRLYTVAEGGMIDWPDDWKEHSEMDGGQVSPVNTTGFTFSAPITIWSNEPTPEDALKPLQGSDYFVTTQHRSDGLRAVTAVTYSAEIPRDAGRVFAIPKVIELAGPLDLEHGGPGAQRVVLTEDQKKYREALFDKVGYAPQKLRRDLSEALEKLNLHVKNLHEGKAISGFGRLKNFLIWVNTRNVPRIVESLQKNSDFKDVKERDANINGVRKLIKILERTKNEYGLPADLNEAFQTLRRIYLEDFNRSIDMKANGVRRTGVIHFDMELSKSKLGVINKNLGMVTEKDFDDDSIRIKNFYISEVRSRTTKLEGMFGVWLLNHAEFEMEHKDGVVPVSYDEKNRAVWLAAPAAQIENPGKEELRNKLIGELKSLNTNFDGLAPVMEPTIQRLFKKLADNDRPVIIVRRNNSGLHDLPWETVERAAENPNALWLEHVGGNHYNVLNNKNGALQKIFLNHKGEIAILEEHCNDLRRWINTILQDVADSDDLDDSKKGDLIQHIQTLTQKLIEIKNRKSEFMRKFSDEIKKKDRLIQISGEGNLCWIRSIKLALYLVPAAGQYSGLAKATNAKGENLDGEDGPDLQDKQTVGVILDSVIQEMIKDLEAGQPEKTDGILQTYREAIQPSTESVNQPKIPKNQPAISDLPEGLTAGLDEGIVASLRDALPRTLRQKLTNDLYKRLNAALTKINMEASKSGEGLRMLKAFELQ